VAGDWSYASGDWNVIRKTCTSCCIEKDLIDFYKQVDGKFGVTSRCKLCVLSSNKKWSVENKDKYREGIKKWVAENKEKVSESQRKWRKSNLGYDAFRSSVYRSRKLMQCPSWANLEAIKEFYENCPKGHHVDHIIPLKGTHASGLHVETNLQYLVAKDNLSKRNRYGW
jgi:hypothetical protein